MSENAVHIPIPDGLAREVARLIFIEVRFTTTETNEEASYHEYFAAKNDDPRRSLEATAKEIVALVVRRLHDADSIRVAHYKRRDDHPEVTNH